LRRTRARIRTQVLPQLENDFSPQIVRRLGELARLAREEEIFWNELVEERYRACIQRQGNQFAVRIHDLLSGPGQRGTSNEGEPAQAAPAASYWLPLTERLIRRLYEEVKGDRRGLSSQNVVEVIRLASESPSGRRVQLPDGITVDRNFGFLNFSRVEANERAQSRKGPSVHAFTYRYEVTLQTNGTTTVSVPELRSCFRLKVIDWPQGESETKRGTEALDADLLGAPLILRNWRPGDAYRPVGRSSTRKLKEMFRTLRAPGRERETWPVLESGGRVIWTRGMPPAEEFCAKKTTRAGVLIEEIKL